MVYRAWVLDSHRPGFELLALVLIGWVNLRKLFTSLSLMSSSISANVVNFVELS